MILAALNSPPPAGSPAPLTGSPIPLEIKDIAPPLDVFPYPLWMVLTAAGLALLLLALLGWLLYRWLQRRPGPPPLSPRALALRDLEVLRVQTSALDPHAFSIAVSDVLRRYIGAAYGLHATQQTSPEFLEAIAGSVKFSDSDRSLLATFLDRCDLLKFAQIEAESGENAHLLESAIAFVQGGRA